MRLTESGRTTV